MHYTIQETDANGIPVSDHIEVVTVPPGRTLPYGYLKKYLKKFADPDYVNEAMEQDRVNGPDTPIMIKNGDIYDRITFHYAPGEVFYTQGPLIKKGS